MGTHRRRESGQKWEGYDQMQSVLDNLATPKGTSANRVKAVASIALQYSKNYKDVVHDVESFIWKTDKKHRLAGLYAMDAIMRQSRSKHGSRDSYVERFGERLATTIRAVREIPDEFQRNVRNVIGEWQVRGYYTKVKLEQDGGHDFLSSKPVKTNTIPKPSTEKLASLLSIIKKQKAKKEQETHGTASPLLPPPHVVLKRDDKDWDEDRNEKRVRTRWGPNRAVQSITEPERAFDQEPRKIEPMHRGVHIPYPIFDPQEPSYPQMPPTLGQDPKLNPELARNYAPPHFIERPWNPQERIGADNSRSRNEINQAKRKTVLCANYPNNCRFGDKCSFAHGEGDLDVKAMEALGRQPRSKLVPEFYPTHNFPNYTGEMYTRQFPQVPTQNGNVREGMYGAPT